MEDHVSPQRRVRETLNSRFATGASFCGRGALTLGCRPDNPNPKKQASPRIIRANVP